MFFKKYDMLLFFKENNYIMMRNPWPEEKNIIKDINLFRVRKNKITLQLKI